MEPLGESASRKWKPTILVARQGRKGSDLPLGNPRGTGSDGRTNPYPPRKVRFQKVTKNGTECHFWAWKVVSVSILRFHLFSIFVDGNRDKTNGKKWEKNGTADIETRRVGFHFFFIFSCVFPFFSILFSHFWPTPKWKKMEKKMET